MSNNGDLSREVSRSSKDSGLRKSRGVVGGGRVLNGRYDEVVGLEGGQTTKRLSNG